LTCLQGHANGIDDLAENAFGRLRFLLQGSVASAGDNAMREDRDSELLEVVRQAKIAAFEKGTSLRGTLQHESAARADTKKKLVGLAGAIDDFEGVVVKAGVDFDTRDCVLHGEHIGDSGDGFDRGNGIVTGAAAQDFALGFVGRVAHLDAHQEAVELRFGERVSAVMLDGILRGDDQEGLRERKRTSVNGDLRFVHGFEKSGLRARRGAIDFVGEHHIGENGAGAKLKFAGLRIVDTDAENVGGEQVRGELNALEGAVKGFRKSLGESGFPGARNVFDEQVAAREKGDEGELDDIFLAENGARDGALQLRNHLRGCGRHLLKTQSLPVTNR